MREPRIIERAGEWNGAHARERVYCGTYARDVPDPAFRFNISVVEHASSANMHEHEYAELVIVLGGRALHVTSWGNHPVNAGDVLVINPTVRHGFKDPKELNLCLIKYDPRQLLTGPRDLVKIMGYHALFERKPRARHPNQFTERLHLSVDELLYVALLISILKAEFDGRSPGRQTIIQSTFLLLVTCLSRLHDNQNNNRSPPMVRMANVISHIQKHFHEPLAVQELARIAHLSPSQFQRTFKRTYSTTPIHFINQVRIHEACEMLQNPNRDITWVALETGFSSSSFFTTQFKRYVGECPSQYRRKKLAEHLPRNKGGVFGGPSKRGESCEGTGNGRSASAAPAMDFKLSASSRSAPLASSRR